jgi:tetratricopeptide (TPR) repeat protein
MNRQRFTLAKTTGAILVAVAAIATTGCGKDFRMMRMEGQRAVRADDYGVARGLFIKAHELRPGDADNLFDLGVVSMHFAQQKIAERNRPAALRELDQAVWYFSRAVKVRPGMQSAIVAKNEALELKGQFDEALHEAEWTAAFVGPSAKAHIFLASELEERGDLDGALLRFRQAVAMEPDNAGAHTAFGRFLLRMNRRDQAIEQFRRAYEINPLEPDVADTLTSLGVALPRTTQPLETP